jgi:hypothetical protein
MLLEEADKESWQGIGHRSRHTEMIVKLNEWEVMRRVNDVDFQAGGTSGKLELP